MNDSGVTLVTGGASGMGLLLVKKLSGAGQKVAVADVNPVPEGEVSGSSSFLCDLSDYEATARLVQEITMSLGPITRLIHCAAIMPGGDLSDMEAAQINRVMAINYMGTVNVTKAVLPEMLARDSGEIAIIGSMAGSVLTHGMGAYSASKAATNTFVEVLQEENRHNNVQIMLVCPPMVNTPLVDQAMAGGPKSLALAKSTDRMASPESIVDAIIEGMEKGTSTVRPGEAGFMMWLRRFFTGLAVVGYAQSECEIEKSQLMAVYQSKVSSLPLIDTVFPHRSSAMASSITSLSSLTATTRC